MNNLEEPRFLAKIGVFTTNIFLTVSCMNIFFYELFSLFIPRIKFGFLTEIVQIIGFTFVIGGNITLFLAYHELGEYWTYPIDGIKKLKLVTSGIYGKIRHPIYLSFILFSLGFELILLDPIMLILFIISFIGLFIQAKEEERILYEYFGQEYMKYKEKTGMFFYFKHSKP